MKKQSVFKRDVFAECQADPRCRNLDLHNWLMRPPQHLMRQPLLLKAVLEHTDAEHADWPRLTAALRKIQARSLAQISGPDHPRHDPAARSRAHLAHISASICRRRSTSSMTASASTSGSKDGSSSRLVYVASSAPRAEPVHPPALRGTRRARATRTSAACCQCTPSRARAIVRRLRHRRRATVSCFTRGASSRSVAARHGGPASARLGRVMRWPARAGERSPSTGVVGRRRGAVSPRTARRVGLTRKGSSAARRSRCGSCCCGGGRCAANTATAVRPCMNGHTAS